MNVILLKDVEKLGHRGEVVSVARGYARNFLLPRKLAEVATEGRVKEVQRIDAQKAMHEARSAEQAAEIAATLGKLVLRFDVKSGPTGSLFGSVTTTDIADEIWRIRKIRVDRRKIGVDGRLDWSSWESQDGGKRSKVEVVAQSVQFLDSRGDGEGGGGGSFVPAGAAQSGSADFPSSPTDDDIPF